jgi:hypothetical protein
VSFIRRDIVTFSRKGDATSSDSPHILQVDQPQGIERMTAWKLRPADLRRMAAKAAEPERERKMLALADHLEDKEKAEARPDGKDQDADGSD